MLKVLYKKLSSNSKGEPNHHPNSHKLQIHRVGKTIVQGIPVLSIFALFGLSFYAITSDFNTLECSAGCGQNSCPPGYALDQFYCCEKLSSYPSPDASASLNISGSDPNAVISTGRGTVAYREHTVQVSASNITSYSLTLSGDSELTLKNGTEKLSGVNNVLGADIPADHWGYSWGNTDADKTSLSYNTPSPTHTTLASGNASNYQINFSNKLVFAARFGEDTPAGNYQANVTLSLAATPATVTSYSVTYNANGGSGTTPTTQTADSIETSYSFTAAEQGSLTKSGYDFLGWAESSSAATAQYAVGSTITLTQSAPNKTLYAIWEKKLTWNDITKMQQMTPEICASVAVGTSKNLTDTRDNNTYTIVKAVDNNCWITQNLRIVNKTITPSDSDVSTNFTIPTSSTSGFSDTNTASVYYSGNSTYGTYYSWYAATAGTGTGSLSTGDASSSVCPKGWQLPQGPTDFQNLANKWTPIWTTNNGYYGRWFGAASSSAGGIFLPAAGHYKNSAPVDTNTHGDYWTRTALNTDGARSLHFSSSSINHGYYSKYRGYTVRCIAYPY